MLYAENTRRKAADGWGRFLNFLDLAGELEQGETPAQRLTADRVGQFIVSLRGRLRAVSVLCIVSDLARAATWLAPGQDWSWIRRHPAVPRNREVRASRRPIIPHEPHLLLFAALQYCRQAEQQALSPPNAVRYRDGLIIAFATWSVLRRTNLAEMEIGTHLRISDGSMRVVFEQIKNGQPVDSLVPDFLRPFVEKYLQIYRPYLMRGAAQSAHLWINIYGEPLVGEGYMHLFSRMGVRLIGKPISTHKTRYAYATTQLNLDPKRRDIVSAGLAHRGTSSVERAYDRSGPEGVSEAWMKVLRRRRTFTHP
jgi:integrase